MAGLVAAARLRELGKPVRLLEKGHRPGGSMLLSSGVVWRHRTPEAFREECPGGDPALQQLIVERLDEALDWLERTAVPASERETGNPRTVGRRFDPRRLTEALARDVALSHPLDELPDDPVVLATGGFAARLACERDLPLRRANLLDPPTRFALYCSGVRTLRQAMCLADVDWQNLTGLSEPQRWRPD